MTSQFQCRFCKESYDEIQEFLDHFETHMTQNEQTQDEQQNASHKDNFSNSESEKEIQNQKSIEDTMNITQRNEAIKTCISEKDLNSEENSYSLNQSSRKKENVSWIPDLCSAFIKALNCALSMFFCSFAQFSTRKFDNCLFAQ